MDPLELIEVEYLALLKNPQLNTPDDQEPTAGGTETSFKPNRKKHQKIEQC